MIIHSYLTDGFFDWAILFVESYAFHHGTKDIIYLCTRDLNKKQIKQLENLYPNIVISNRPLNIKNIAKRARLTQDKILDLKNHIENSAVTKNTYIWKQAISVEDRYRTSINEAIEKYPNEDYLIHFDIDMYFRKPLTELFDLVKSNDISIRFRLNSKINRKVMGGLIGFKLGKKTNNFMNKWGFYIDKVPLYKKPLGYGQTSFYYAYRDLKNNYKWGDIPPEYISPRFKDTDFIWSGNTKKGKAHNLKICKKDFNKRRKQ